MMMAAAALLGSIKEGIRKKERDDENDDGSSRLPELLWLVARQENGDD